MLNVHLSSKPPSSWRILFRSGVYPSQFSRLKNSRALVVPDRGFRKGGNFSSNFDAENKRGCNGSVYL